MKYKESYGAIISVSNLSWLILNLICIGLINLKFHMFLFDNYLSQH
jgi:hypothetical protein